MTIRKIADIETLEELGLDNGLLKVLAPYTPAEIVRAVRKGYPLSYAPLMELKGVGEARARKITKIVIEAGFICTESLRSWATRIFLASLDPVLRSRYLSDEEYESRTELAAEQIGALLQLMDEQLTLTEVKVLTMRFGLNGEPPCRLEQCSAELKLTPEHVRHIEIKALNRMHARFDAGMLTEIFPGFLSVPEQPKPIESFTDPVDRMYIEDLDLPVRTFNRLKRAHVHCVGHLRELAADKVEELRYQIGGKNFQELQEKLSMLSVNLA